MTKFARCECFYTNNIFIAQLGIHVKCFNRDQFFDDYFENLGIGRGEFENILEHAEREKQRRRNFAENVKTRTTLYQTTYVRLHPELFEFQEFHLDSRFIDSYMNNFENFRRDNTLNENYKLFQFPLFSPTFCKKICEEVTNLSMSGLPVERPNTMNNYGILLDELGMTSFFDELRQKYIDPLVAQLFPEWIGKSGLDSHRVFTVKYENGGDVDLAMHFDNAEMTLNICITEDDKFTGGDVYFGDSSDLATMRCVSVKHKLGYAILHCGRQFHGAIPLMGGCRENVIMWMRSSSVRNTLCPMCQRTPTLVPEKSGYADGFLTEKVDFCSLV